MNDVETISELIDAGAIFYVSHSGGKDSQAMYSILMDFIPVEQIVVVHADLGVIEWKGVQDHIKATICHDLNVVRAVKTFFDMVRHRAKTRPDVPSWPSSATRQCTSDLKRNPIYKFIRNDMKKRDVSLGVNCTGIRAEESPARAKKQPLEINKTLTIKSRKVFEWKPIHDLSTKQVFEEIAASGQKPFHAYSKNKRLSCVFCIMGCTGDLAHGAKQRPDLLKAYSDLEKETGWTMFNGKTLAERISDHVET